MTQDTSKPYGRKADDPSTPTSLEMVLLRSGQVKLRKIDGWQEMKQVNEA